MKRGKRVLIFALCLALLMTLSGCKRAEYAASDTIIIDAKTLPEYIGKEGVVIVDMQDSEGYANGHVEGAVNLQIGSVLVNLPVENMLAPKGKVSTVLGEAGIGNDTQVVIYDEGRSLNASRLWWTMLVYGLDNVKVISGGLPAIKAAGVALTTERPEIIPAEFTVEDRTKEYVATMKDVRQQVDEPDPNVRLLDTRSDAEYEAEGKIPGAIMYDYMHDFYNDGTFLSTQAIRINYPELGIWPENETIMYCKTSMRAAVTFLCLYDAGYRNLKLYDGAWIEWTASGTNPIDAPTGAAAPSARDSS